MIRLAGGQLESRHDAESNVKTLRFRWAIWYMKITAAIYLECASQTLGSRARRPFGRPLAVRLGVLIFQRHRNGTMAATATGAGTFLQGPSCSMSALNSHISNLARQKCYASFCSLSLTQKQHRQAERGFHTFKIVRAAPLHATAYFQNAKSHPVVTLPQLGGVDISDRLWP